MKFPNQQTNIRLAGLCRCIINSCSNRGRHKRQPGTNKTLFIELSANQQISPWVIILSIQQPDRTMLLPGDYYPGTIDQASATTNLYSSIVQTMDIYPLPLVQGQTAVVRIKTTEPVQLEGNLAETICSLFNRMPMNTSPCREFTPCIQ